MNAWDEMSGTARLASLGHLAALGSKIETLHAALQDTAGQIAYQVRRESDIWCQCRLAEDLLALPLTRTSSDCLAFALGLGALEDLKYTAESCACKDVWLTGDMPIDEELPRRPGVYICFDDQDRPAYIGTSKDNVRARLKAHYRDPAKPRLARWAAFFPGRDGESAAVWEVRLIEQHKPYLNKQHADGRPSVDWEPQPKPDRAKPKAWYDRDELYLWFRTGPGSRLDWTGSQPWQVAKVLRNLVNDGVTREIIEQAVDITNAASPEYSEIAYMAGVARTLLEEDES